MLRIVCITLFIFTIYEYCFSQSKDDAMKNEGGIDSAFVKPREVEMKITYHINGISICDTDTVTMYEFSEEPVYYKKEKKNDTPTLLLYIASQKDYPNQRDLEYISIEPKPDLITEKDIDGNVIEYFDLSDRIKNHTDIKITRRFKFTAYETSFKIDPEKVGKYNITDPVYRYYTRSQEFAELTPEVVALAKKIVGNEKNPYYMARAIYKWCVENIDYVYPPDRGILHSLPRRTGDCGEYSLIFMSLCRSLGIPSRVVNGRWCCKAKKNYHVWNEFYLPGYGWIPSDATDGRIIKDSPEKLAGGSDMFYYFGNLDSGRFISSKGTSIQLYPSPPWHDWGLPDKNNNPIFFQAAATVSSNLHIEKQYAEFEVIKGDDILW